MLSSSALQRAWARGQADMAKKCEITGKKPMVGHNVSHSQRRTKRRWLPNLRTVTVLDENGNFTGFDVVIGNPPYIYNRDIKSKERDFYQKKYNSADDLYVYFTLESINLLQNNGYLTLITPNTYFTLSTRADYRIVLLKNKELKFTYSGFCFECICNWTRP